MLVAVLAYVGECSRPRLGCKVDMRKNVTVLVMDDAPVVRSLLVAMLGEIDAIENVLQAEDVSSALNMIEQHQPDVAILDVKVPGQGPIRNGIDVLRRVKKTRPDISVIILTNHASPRYRTECERAGADYFFDKSSEFERLLDTVAALTETEE